MVAQAASRTFVANADGNRNFPYLVQNGKRWFLNWNWIENDLNRNGRIAVSGNWRQMRGWLGGLLLACDLPKPAAEHSSHFGQLFGDDSVFFIVQRLDFPCNLKKEFGEV